MLVQARAFEPDPDFEESLQQLQNELGEDPPPEEVQDLREEVQDSPEDFQDPPE